MQLRARRDEKAYLTTPEESKELATKFSGEIINELGTLVKAVVWFGSQVRRPFTDGKKPITEEVLYGSDIDVLIVLDDLVHVLTREVVTAYRVVVEKTASRVSRRLHITTMPITNFWDYSMNGDPILINMLRDGEAVFDTGCFGIAKQLLGSEQIKPSKEIVWTYMTKAPVSVANSHHNMLQAVLNLYWGVMDSAHAMLLHKGIVPDNPDDLISLIKENFIDTGMLDKSHLMILSEFHNVGMMIMHSQLHKVSGDHYDRYKREADKFIHAARGFLVR